MASFASPGTKLLFTLLVIGELLEHDDDVNLQLGEDLFTLICDPESDPDSRHDFRVSNPIDRFRVGVSGTYGSDCPRPSAGLLHKDIDSACHVCLRGSRPVERGTGKRKHQKQTMYYVVLLDLSTELTSVWLLYAFNPLRYLVESIRYILTT